MKTKLSDLVEDYGTVDSLKFNVRDVYNNPYEPLEDETSESLGLEGLLDFQEDSPLFVSSGAGFRPASGEQILKTARKVAQNKLPAGTSFTSPELVKRFIETQLMGRDIEVFGAMYLSNQNKLIKFEIMSEGTVNKASVYPREIVKEALLCNASAVIISHNHPSGSLEASRADLNSTNAIQAALALMDIRLLDHILVAGSESISFMEKGHIG